MTDEDKTWVWIDQLCKVVEAAYRLGAESDRAELERAHDEIDRLNEERDSVANREAALLGRIGFIAAQLQLAVPSYLPGKRQEAMELAATRLRSAISNHRPAPADREGA